MTTKIFGLMLVLGFVSFHAAAARSMASARHANRVEHARELMGASYNKSVVSRIEKTKDLEKTIHQVVQKRLPAKYKYQASTISRTIIDEANKHSLDPYFVMAIISGESSFNPVAIGPVGEIGLMQIRPATGEWMAEILKTKWRGEKTLRDPVQNIKLGTAYLAWLRNKFEGHGQLYLAAYNMGPRSVRKAVSRNVYPKDYPIHVMKRYIAFYKEIGRKKSTL
jgi:soluble lytic murein transglycosylase-like protein